jgi:hypothetical protein
MSGEKLLVNVQANAMQILLKLTIYSKRNNRKTYIFLLIIPGCEQQRFFDRQMVILPKPYRISSDLFQYGQAVLVR